ncbi:hypothetical protein [Paenibacillus anseongense]|uniref:hypothetical protein n=1 Tax=Paenibacillus anseongense TaxID=2682845 RepID=UPI002DB6AAC7|nr:hypothetical protein [Paenibacillus anseongense]MEC0265137.1 hypothetical protein [Paenibacillus anseongense]
MYVKLTTDDGIPVTESNGLPIEATPSNAQTQDSGNNAVQTLTRVLVAGKSHYITSIEVSISGAAAANDITVELKDGSTTVWKEIIGSGAPRGERAGIVFNSPIKLTAGNAANLVVSAGGTGVITSANMAGYTA